MGGFLRGNVPREIYKAIVSSAALLKQLADGTDPKAQAKPTALDGITPLDVDATTADPGSPYNGLRLDQQASTNKASSCFFSHSEAALCCKGPPCKALVATPTSAVICCQAPLFKAHVANPTAFREGSFNGYETATRQGCMSAICTTRALPKNITQKYTLSILQVYYINS